jgi:hypothetical protein
MQFFTVSRRPSGSETHHPHGHGANRPQNPHSDPGNAGPRKAGTAHLTTCRLARTIDRSPLRSLQSLRFVIPIDLGFRTPKIRRPKPTAMRTSSLFKVNSPLQFRRIPALTRHLTSQISRRGAHTVARSGRCGVPQTQPPIARWSTWTNALTAKNDPTTEAKANENVVTIQNKAPFAVPANFGPDSPLDKRVNPPCRAQGRSSADQSAPPPRAPGTRRPQEDAHYLRLKSLPLRTPSSPSRSTGRSVATTRCRLTHLGPSK